MTVVRFSLQHLRPFAPTAPTAVFELSKYRKVADRVEMLSWRPSTRWFGAGSAEWQQRESGPPARREPDHRGDGCQSTLSARPTSWRMSSVTVETSPTLRRPSSGSWIWWTRHRHGQRPCGLRVIESEKYLLGRARACRNQWRLLYLLRTSQGWFLPTTAFSHRC